MKHIKLNNYYDTLTEKQKLGHADKQGALFYYEWFDVLYEMCSLEESGCLLLALLYYDKFGGSKPLPSDLQERLESDRTLTITFLTLQEKLAASSRKWINQHRVGTPKKNPAIEEDELINIDDEEMPF